jgi:hypothetical protein
LCSVENCIATFDNEIDLNTHVLCNQHQIDVDSAKTRSSNDAARIHLLDTLKTVNTTSQIQATTILQQQCLASEASTTSKFPINKYINYFNLEGWGLRVRKPGCRIDQSVKNFIEWVTFSQSSVFSPVKSLFSFLFSRNIWKDGMQNGRKIQAEAIRDMIRSERNVKKEVSIIF